FSDEHPEAVSRCPEAAFARIAGSSTAPRNRAMRSRSGDIARRGFAPRDTIPRRACCGEHHEKTDLAAKWQARWLPPLAQRLHGFRAAATIATVGNLRPAHFEEG